MIGKIIEDDEAHGHMPDYAFSFDGDNLIVRPKKEQAAPAPLPSSVMRLDPDIHVEAARRAPGWDTRSLEQEWRDWVAEKGMIVHNADANFLKFCETRGPYKREA